MLDPLTERELEILRHIADGLSDREVAEALYLSLNTIKWHNRQIYSKLGVSNRKQAVALASQEGLLDAGPAPSDAASDTLRNNLPAPITSFVGREEEIGEVTRLLASARLLTLTGPGGVGKTRLVLQVATANADAGDFDDGVYFVDLAPLSDPALVASSIALTLYLAEVADEPLSETIKRSIHNKQMLLLLDNFEHLLEAAPLLSELLEAAPGLKILATSRENLSLYGEQVYPVPPLESVDAVELFYDRGRAVKPDFDPDEEDLSTVGQICSRLDELPLAIELAASRVKLLPPQTLLQRLEGSLDALKGTARDAPARHQTLRAALDWSYALLDPDEKVLFNRLGVFAAGCSLEAAEVVCTQGLAIDLFDGLESLLDKSLLRQEQGVAGEPRFVMLETVHEYAKERLEESDAATSVKTWHAEHYVALAEQAELGIWERRAARWFNRLEQELYNIREALGWSLDGGDAVLGLRMSGALRWFWYVRHLSEGRRWAERVLEQRVDAPQRVRARAFNTAGMMAYFQGDYEQARTMFQEALDLSRGLSDRHTTAWSMTHLGSVKSHEGEYSYDQELLEEALALFRELGDPPGISYALTALGESMRVRGEYEQARALYEESLAVRLQNDVYVYSAQYLNLGTVMRRLGDDSQAWKLYEDALQVGLEVGQKPSIAHSLMGLAGLIGERRQPERAARLFGAAETMLEDTGFHIESVDRPDYERDVAAVCAQLDEATFETAWAEGRAMTLEEAVSAALEWAQDLSL